MDYAENNSQAQADQPIAGRSTLVLKIACANLPHTGPRSNHPAISVLVVGVYLPSHAATAAHAISPQAANRIQSP